LNTEISTFVNQENFDKAAEFTALTANKDKIFLDEKAK
jgi:hypothetical protein